MSIPRYIPPRRIFYVYALFDKSGIVRYIGKGHGNRWLAHDRPSKNKNDWLKNIFIKRTLRKLGEIPKVKIRQRLTEKEAFEIEVALLKAVGIWPDGPLCNLTTNRNGPTSEKIKAWHASRTPEERSATLKKAQASMTAEARSARSRNNSAHIPREEKARRFKAILYAMSPEQRRDNGRKGGTASAAATTLEQKREYQRKGIDSYLKNTTPEQRRENYKKTGIAKLTKEQLSTNGTKGVAIANANRTPEEHSAIGRKGAQTLHASRSREERVKFARIANLAAQKAITFEDRSRGAYKRAKTLTKDQLREIALKGVETRRRLGKKTGGTRKNWRWINNGSLARKLDNVKGLPSGWVYGMLKRKRASSIKPHFTLSDKPSATATSLPTRPDSTIAT